jgi:hypothetical protein
MSWVKRKDGTTIRDRRTRTDRRRSHVLFSDWRWAIAGRRRAGRREDDTAHTGVDIYNPRVGVLALAIFLLSCLDAAFTLTLIWGNLGVELNPIMRSLITHDAQTFVNLKLVFTGASLVFLVALADARFLQRIRVRVLMYGILILYSLIVAYEITNLGLGILVL